MAIKFIDHGLKVGPAKVVVLVEDKRYGVGLLVQGVGRRGEEKGCVELRITPGGRIQIVDYCY